MTTVQLAPDVWQVLSPIPESQLGYTLTYVLRGAGNDIHIIDPGWDSDENRASLERSLAGLGFALADIATLVATHHHPDHLGIAARLREASGARIVLSVPETEVLRIQLAPESSDRSIYERQLDAWGVPHDRREELRAQFHRPALLEPVTPDRTVVDGEMLVLGEHRLEVVLTPGHTGGHACLVDEDRGFVYTGDHVLPRTFAGVGIGSLPGTHPLADYFRSLRRLEPYDHLTVLPGHEEPFTGLGERLDAIASHHLRRTDEVRDLSARLGDASVWDYASEMTWTSGWRGLHGFWLHSALNQTQMHLDVVRSTHPV